MLIKDCIILAILVSFGPREDQITKVRTRLIDEIKSCKIRSFSNYKFLSWLLTLLINFAMGFILSQRSLHCLWKE